MAQIPQNMAILLQQILSAKRIGNFLKLRDLDYLLEEPANGTPLPEHDDIYVQGSFTWNMATTSADNTSVPQDQVFQLQDLAIEFPKGGLTLVAGKFGSGKTLLLLTLLGEARMIQGNTSYLVSDLKEPRLINNLEWRLRLDGVAYVPQVSY